MAGSSEAANPFVKRQQQRTLWVVVSASLLLLGVAVALILYKRSQQSGVLIHEKNSAVTIKVNGRAVQGVLQSNGIYLPLTSGQYRIEIDKQGSQPFIQDVTTTKGSVTSIRPAYTLVATSSITSANNLAFVRVSPDRKSVYYLGDNRTRLYRLEVANQVPIPLTDQPLSSILDVQWSNNPYVALILRPDGTYLHEIPRFDFTSQKYDKVAGPEVISPAWDPNNSNRLAFALNTDGGEESIAISDMRFENIQRLAFTSSIPEARIAWSPDSSYLTLTGRGNNSALQNLYYFDLTTTALVQISQGGKVGVSKISPDSRYILYEVLSQNTITRKLYDHTNQKSQDAGEGSIDTVTWKDGSSFYEVSSDGRSIVEKTISGSITPVSISLPGTDRIRELEYVTNPNSLVIRTDSGVYLVNVEN